MKPAICKNLSLSLLNNCRSAAKQLLSNEARVYVEGALGKSFHNYLK